MYRFTLSFFALFVLVPLAQADRGDLQISRFAGPLNDLNRLYPQGRLNPRSVGERALTSGARGGTFNLQGLTRMYKKLDKKFDDIGDTVKDLEDAIGEFDKWTKVLASTRGQRTQQEEIARIQRNLTQAREDYFKMLVDREWVRPDGGKTFVQKAIETVQNFNWPKKKEDRDFLLDQMDEQIKKVRDTRYDVRILEEGNGLHELRREIRWILIQSQSTAGLVAFDRGNSCPIPAFGANSRIEERIAQIDRSATRFLTFPDATTEVDPCLVPRCLIAGAVFFVTQLGDIKDKAEQELNRSGGGDRVPQRLVGTALQTQQFLLQSNLLETLHQTFKSCRKN